MAIQPHPDRVEKLMTIDHGTVCLITDNQADLYIKKSREKPNKPPANRLSRPCGGKGGFDDYVERWYG